MTKAQAKKLSLIKWDYARKTGCGTTKLIEWLCREHINIYEMQGFCPYCEKYYDGINYSCSNCPLFKLWSCDCPDSVSLWRAWSNAKIPRTRKKYAELIYQDIKRS